SRSGAPRQDRAGGRAPPRRSTGRGPRRRGSRGSVASRLLRRAQAARSAALVARGPALEERGPSLLRVLGPAAKRPGLGLERGGGRERQGGVDQALARLHRQRRIDRKRVV